MLQDSLVSIACFQTASEESRLLGLLIKRLAASYGYAVEVVADADSVLFLRKVLESDLVILDGTMESMTEHNFLLPQSLVYDHVLVVSRTYVPDNFVGNNWGGVPVYPERQDNAVIISFLEKQFIRFKSRLPRRKPAGIWYHLLSGNGIVSTVAMMAESIKLMRDTDREKRWRQEGEVFISFRTCYAQEVHLLAERIRSGNYHDKPKSVRVYFAEEFALRDEVLTLQRMWQIISSIDRPLAAAEELWIYNTSDYLDSWWTQGELLTLSYRSYNNSMKLPRIRVYDPVTDCVADVDRSILPEFYESTKKRMARWYANSDPYMAGPEARFLFQGLSSLPVLEKISYLNDDVFSDMFWECSLLKKPDFSTSRDVEADGQRHTASSVAELSEKIKNLSVDKFVNEVKSLFYVKTPDEMQQILSRDGVFVVEDDACICQYRITALPPRYLWCPLLIPKIMELKMNAKARGEDDSVFNQLVLLSLPVYRLAEQEVLKRYI